MHEKAHIKRFDHIVKLIAFIALSIHWFNPLVWIAYDFMSKDMEMSCDEMVISSLGTEGKKEYSACLLELASKRSKKRMPALSFSEGDTKGRILNVLSYKKPAFFISVIICAIIALMALFFLTDKTDDKKNMNYWGVDSVILEINREDKLIKAQNLHDNINGPSEFNAFYDEKTYFCKIEEGASNPIDLSLDDFKEGEKVIFNIAEKEKDGKTYYYAVTIQKIRDALYNEANSNFVFPVDGGKITVPFGDKAYPGHTGIDIGNVPEGTPVRASASGIVTDVIYGGSGYGNHVIIYHGDNIETLYAHNKEISVEIGDKVEGGQVIASVGKTGNATGPVLHFEVRADGKYVNPENYIG